MGLEEPSRLRSPSVRAEPDDEAIAEVDGNGLIVTMNRAFEELLGYTSEELLGDHYHRVTPVESAAFVAKQFELKRRNPERTTRYETVVLHRDGRRLRVRVTSRRVEQPGEPARIRAAVRLLD